jgi:diguanylate cyclase (GGDEF)-like protein
LRMATAIDPLTQVFSRRFFVESIRQKWFDAHTGQSMGVVVVDVDWFKQYNDTYGHLAGDECLRNVAAVLQAASDGERVIAGRIGGEEFGVFMMDATPDEIGALTETIRADIEALACEHRVSPYGVVTVSIGVSIACKNCETVLSHRDVFADADRALYASKDAGRNRVTIG